MDLLALAERVERHAPTGHYDVDRENERALNEAIGLAVGVGHRIKVGDPALGNDRWVPTPLRPYVTSLDAAMTLVPEGHEWLRWSVDTMTVMLPPQPGDDEKQWARHIECRGATPALALCAAALRARAGAME